MGKGGADFEYFIYCWVMLIAPGDQYSLILATSTNANKYEHCL